MSSKQKILIWDIESYPLVVTTWQLFEPRLDYGNIVEDWGLICGAWKWVGEKEVHAVAVNPRKPKDDKNVIHELHKVLSEADVIVAHYGDKFDLPKFNARAIFHGLPPIPPIQTIDTKKVAKKYFGFSSNRLDYLGQYLGLGKKLPTGYGLWLSVLAGNEKALAKMVRYNKQDVKLLEKVYLKLRPFMRNHPNENLHGPMSCCPTCGSKQFQKRGLKYFKTTARQQYQCSNQECRAWFSGDSVATVKFK